MSLLHVYRRSPTLPMSNDSARTLLSCRHLPLLTKDNRMKWQTALMAYLTP